MHALPAEQVHIYLKENVSINALKDYSETHNQMYANHVIQPVHHAVDHQPKNAEDAKLDTY